MGTKVKTPEGEEIGVVQNLMIDPQHDTIEFIVLCYADFIGKTNRFFAIPTRLLTVKSTGNSTIFLEIDKQKLIGAHKDSSGYYNGSIHEFSTDEFIPSQEKRLVTTTH